MSNKIKKHWNDLAETKESSYKASWEDYYMLQKEIDEVCKYIGGIESICDMGCNNGYCDFEFLKRCSCIDITGVDYAENAIEQAKNDLVGSYYEHRCRFLVGNILDKDTYPNDKFDKVLVKRTIINLDTEEDQIQALINLKSLLKANGKIILMEAVEENLNRLNSLRKEFSLPDLSQPWHNKYLNSAVIKSIYDNFHVEVDENYASSYYIISRVFYPWMSKVTPNTKISYLSEINRLASMFPNIGDYGIQRLFVLSI